MWLLGHLSLGYFSALIVGRYTKEKLILPLVWLVSFLPDTDFLFQGVLVHRGPTHSIVVAVILLLPLLLWFRGGYVYLAALASHTLIGDFLLPPEQLFWPLSSGWFGAPPSLQLHSGLFETGVEISLFLLMLLAILFIRERRVSVERS